MTDTFIIPTQLMQALHEYLLNKPMREVEGLVNGLRQCVPNEPIVAEED